MKKDKGITLIALVVTIIVLLILAGITISLIIGQNGIIGKANRAKLVNDQQSIKERLLLAIQDATIEKIDQPDLKTMDYLRGKEYIKEQASISDVVQVESLMGQKLSSGNGKEDKDIYVIENGHLIYYDKDKNPEDLGDLGIIDRNDIPYINDPGLFEYNASTKSIIGFKEKYYRSAEGKYYTQDNQLIENIIFPSQIDGQPVEKVETERYADEPISKSWEQLKNIKFSTGIKTLSNFLNVDSSSLETIILATSMTEIRDSLSSCNLKELVLGENIIRISNNNSPALQVENLILGMRKAYIQLEGMNVKRLLVSNDLEIENGSDFPLRNAKIEEIEFKEGVTRIPANMFYQADLSTVTKGRLHIPSSMKTIEPGAFVESRIPDVSFDNNIEEANEAFDNLQTLSIPKSSKLKNIDVISYNGQIQQANIYLTAEQVNATGAFNVLFHISDTLTLFVTNGAIGEYTRLPLGGSTINITLEDGNSLMPAFDYANAQNVNLVIPNTVTRIAENAFENYQPNHIELPSSITTIGNNAFAGASNVQTIKFGNNNVNVFPDNIEIGEGALSSCKLQGELTIGKNSDIKDRAFDGNKITKVTVKENGIIGMQSFSSCLNLQDVIIEKNVDIYDEAFQGCTNLTKMTLNEGITKIGDRFISNCSKLKEITIPNSIIDIYEPFSGSSLTKITFAAGNNPIPAGQPWGAPASVVIEKLQ